MSAILNAKDVTKARAEFRKKVGIKDFEPQTQAPPLAMPRRGTQRYEGRSFLKVGLAVPSEPRREDPRPIKFTADAKDGIEASGIAVFGVNGVEKFEAVAVIKPEAARVVAESQNRSAFLVASFDGNRSIFAEFKMRGRNRLGMDKIAARYFRRSCPIERL